MAEELSGIETSAQASQPRSQLSPAQKRQGEAQTAVPLLRIEGVVKKFGSFRAVDGVSLDIAAGEFFALLGPSGCDACADVSIPDSSSAIFTRFPRRRGDVNQS